MAWTNPEEYYDDSTNHGDYQYVTLDNIINNFILNYVGDDKLINNVPRYNILFHAKRGLQEISFDALKEVKAIELDLSDTLALTLPENYVDYVRVSWVDDNGHFRPMVHNHDTVLAKHYLQDNEYEILFDDEGYPLEAFPNSYSQTESGNEFNYPLVSRYSICNNYDSDEGLLNTRFGLETTKANANGWFNVNKRKGVMNFSSNVEFKTIVLEYISDGLEYEDAEDIKVHKFAEQAIYEYIKWMLLDNKIGIQEYIVKRAKKGFYNARRIAKGRIQQLRYNELVQALRGRDKWIK